MDEIKEQIALIDAEIASKLEERKTLIEALLVLQQSNNCWKNPPKSVMEATNLQSDTNVATDNSVATDNYDANVTTDNSDANAKVDVESNSIPKKLNKGKFRELTTVDDLLEIFIRVWPEAYQFKLKRLPGHLVKFDNPRFDYTIIPVHLNNVGIPLLGGKLRRNDERLQDRNDFWASFWHGMCKLLRTELLVGQRFSIQEMYRWENTIVEKGFFTLTVQVTVYLTPSERSRIDHGIKYLKRHGHASDDETTDEITDETTDNNLSVEETTSDNL